MPAGTARLELRDVRWAYDDGARFGPIDLCVDAGEWLTVIGHHGSGKTSLLRLAAGFEAPTHGTVLIDGLPTGSEAGAVHVSAMLHPLPLDDELTMRQHLQLAAGTSPDWNDDADDLADRLGLADRFDDPVRMFSRGMRQKLAICMALLPRFDLLILDEPFDGLDAPSRRAVLELIDLAHRYGATVLTATSDIDAAARGDRVLAMGRGRVIADTSPDADLDALIEDPKH